MPWNPEDWKVWESRDHVQLESSPAPVQVLRQLLTRLPGRSELTVGDLGCGCGTRLPFLATSFGNVVAVDSDEWRLAEARATCGDLGVEFARAALSDLDSLRGTLDVAVAVDSIRTANTTMFDRTLVEIRRSLVEGGIFMATFPAIGASPVPMPLRMRHAPEPGGTPELHEVELQYRLRGAGFQGLRMRRFEASGGHGETLLCMAVRRALN